MIGVSLLRPYQATIVILAIIRRAEKKLPLQQTKNACFSTNWLMLAIT